MAQIFRAERGNFELPRFTAPSAPAPCLASLASLATLHGAQVALGELFDHRLGLLRRRNERLAVDNMHLRNTVRNLKASWSKKERRAVQLEAAQAQLRAQISVLAEHVCEELERMPENDYEMGGLRHLQVRCASLERRIVVLQQAETAAKVACQDAEAVKSKLQKQVASLLEHRSTTEVDQHRCLSAFSGEGLEAASAQKDKLLATLRSKLADAQSVSAASNLRHMSELDAVRADTHELLQHLDETEATHAKERHELQDQVEALLASRATAAVEMENLQRQIDDTEALHAQERLEMQQRLTALRVSSAAAASDAQDVQHQLAAVRQSRMADATERQKLLLELQQLQQQLVDQQAKRHDLQKKIVDDAAEKQDLLRQQAVLESTCATLRLDQQDLQHELAILRTSSSNAAAERKDLQQQLSLLQSSTTVMQADKQTLDEIFSALQSSHAALLQDKQTLEEQLTNLRETSAALDAERNDWKEQCYVLQGSSALQHNEKQNLEQQLSSVGSSRAKLLKEKKELQQALDGLQVSSTALLSEWQAQQAASTQAAAEHARETQDLQMELAELRLSSSATVTELTAQLLEMQNTQQQFTALCVSSSATASELAVELSEANNLRQQLSVLRLSSSQSADSRTKEIADLREQLAVFKESNSQATSSTIDAAAVHAREEQNVKQELAPLARDSKAAPALEKKDLQSQPQGHRESAANLDEQLSALQSSEEGFMVAQQAKTAAFDREQAALAERELALASSVALEHASRKSLKTAAAAYDQERAALQAALADLTAAKMSSEQAQRESLTTATAVFERERAALQAELEEREAILLSEQVLRASLRAQGLLSEQALNAQIVAAAEAAKTFSTLLADKERACSSAVASLQQRVEEAEAERAALVSTHEAVVAAHDANKEDLQRQVQTLLASSLVNAKEAKAAKDALLELQSKQVVVDEEEVAYDVVTPPRSLRREGLGLTTPPKSPPPSLAPEESALISGISAARERLQQQLENLRDGELEPVIDAIPPPSLATEKEVLELRESCKRLTAKAEELEFEKDAYKAELLQIFETESSAAARPSVASPLKSASIVESFVEANRELNALNRELLRRVSGLEAQQRDHAEAEARSETAKADAQAHARQLLSALDVARMSLAASDQDYADKATRVEELTRENAALLARLRGGGLA